MKIVNRGDAAHVLSFRGKETLLAPGNYIEVDLTKDEAVAIPAPFTAEGDPVPVPAADADKREVKK
jgi:hypothetical protein